MSCSSKISQLCKFSKTLEIDQDWKGSKRTLCFLSSFFTAATPKCQQTQEWRIKCAGIKLSYCGRAFPMTWASRNKNSMWAIFDMTAVWVSITANTNLDKIDFVSKWFTISSLCPSRQLHEIQLITSEWKKKNRHNDNNAYPVFLSNFLPTFTLCLLNSIVSRPMLNNVFLYFTPLSAKCVGLRIWWRWVSDEKRIPQTGYIFIWCSLWHVSVFFPLRFIKCLLATTFKDALKRPNVVVFFLTQWSTVWWNLL